MHGEGAPEWEHTLRDYQMAGALFLADAGTKFTRARILADAPGFGKTRTALGFARLRLQRAETRVPLVLILCPAMARADWLREAAVVWPEVGAVTVGIDDVVSRRKREDLIDFHERQDEVVRLALRCTSPQLLICSHGSIERLLEIIKEEGMLLGTVIADEAHAFKKPGVDLSKHARQIIARAERTALLTGTPIHNRAMDLWNLLDLCSLGRFGSKWAFAKRYFQIINGAHGISVGKLIDKEGLAAAVKDFVLVRTVKEAYGELPPRIRKLVTVPVIKKARGGVKLTEVIEIERGLRRAVALKIPTLIKLVEELDEPLVVYTHERDDAVRVHSLLERRGVASILATGYTAAKDRVKRIEAWKRGEARVLVCTMDAVQTSATLTRACAMIFLDLDWLPGKMIQCEGRIDPARQPEGQRRPARYYYIVTEFGIDQVIAERNVEKIEEAEGILARDENAHGLAGVLAQPKVSDEPAMDVLADLVARINARGERMSALERLS